MIPALKKVGVGLLLAGAGVVWFPRLWGEGNGRAPARVERAADAGSSESERIERSERPRSTSPRRVLEPDEPLDEALRSTLLVIEALLPRGPHGPHEPHAMGRSLDDLARALDGSTPATDRSARVDRFAGAWDRRRTRDALTEGSR